LNIYISGIKEEYDNTETLDALFHALLFQKDICVICIYHPNQVMCE